ncbi:hypothetical protein FS837_005295 [Tulasnella sp. UAMH 9824]|nr:hypothetical protein FS837_005295 [Tulasnella sp. UAMH 9824]
MEYGEPRRPGRNHPVTEVPRLGPPVVNPPLPDDNETALMYAIWTIYKWLMDQLWVITLILVGLLFHNYMVKVLQLRPDL